MMLLVVSLALVAAVSANGGYRPQTSFYTIAAPPAAPAPAPYWLPSPAVYAKPHIGGSEFRSQDVLGQVSYAYTNDDGIQKEEVRNADGEVAGRYGYTSPEGTRVDISYTAGEGGFQAQGAALPQNVQPTPEVVEATRNHEQAIREMEAKLAAAPQYIEPIPVAYAHQIPYAAQPISYAPIRPVSYGSPFTYTAARPITVAAPRPLSYAAARPLAYAAARPLSYQPVSYAWSSPGLHQTYTMKPQRPLHAVSYSTKLVPLAHSQSHASAKGHSELGYSYSFSA